MPESVILTAKLVSDSTPLSGKTVNFYYWDGSQYVSIGSATTNADGEASITYDVTSDTTFKAEFAGDETYAASEDTAPYSYGELQDLHSQLTLQKSSFIDYSASFEITKGASTTLSSTFSLLGSSSANLLSSFGAGYFTASKNVSSMLYIPSTYSASRTLSSTLYVPTTHSSAVNLSSSFEVPVGFANLSSKIVLPKAIRWKVEYWDGSSWQFKPDAVVEQIVQELNGHEEAIFYLPNTESNRSFVSENHRIRIIFGSQVLFSGKLYGVEYRSDVLRCFVYNECYETMKARTHTGTYSNVSAKTILQYICNDAGVVAGECPDVPVSVRFHYATCFDAATFLAKTLNRDFWADYDESGKPRFNIGVRATNKDVTKLEAQLKDNSGNPLSGKTIYFYYSLDGTTWLYIGSATTNYNGIATIYHAAIQDIFYKAEFKGDEQYEASSDTESYTQVSAAKTFTPVKWPSRTIDRAKKRDKVIVVGIDESGNEVIGTAGTGENVVVIRERKAIDQDTANALASKYYEELNKESSGAELPAAITDAFDLFPGDTVTLENELLGYSGIYRVLKTTKRLDRVTVELDRATTIIEKLFEETQRYEELGIYPITRQQMPGAMPSGTSFPSNPKVGDLFYRTDEDRVYRFNGTTWEKVVVTIGEGTEFPWSPKTGDLFYRTDEQRLYKWNGSQWILVQPDMLSAPPENLVLNQAFETDSDGDGIPDNWHYETVYGSAQKSTPVDVKRKGGRCVAVTTSGSGNKGEWISDFIPVAPGKRYKVIVDVLGSAEGFADDTPVGIKCWAHKDDSSPTEISIGESYILNEWYQVSGEFEVPLDKYYVTIHLRNDGFNGTIYWDDVILSTVRLNQFALDSILNFGGTFWWRNHWKPEGIVDYETINDGYIYFYADKLVLLANLYDRKVRAWKTSWMGTWNRKRRLKIVAQFSDWIAQAEDQCTHLVTGGISDISSTSNTAEHFGFKVVPVAGSDVSHLFATVGDGSNESTLDLGEVDWSKRYTLEADFVGDSVRFYVDGEYVGKITENLPSGDTNAVYLMHASVSNNWYTSCEVAIYFWGCTEYT